MDLTNEDYSRLLINEGLVSRGLVGECMEELEALLSQGQNTDLLEILVRRGEITRAAAHRIAVAAGKRILECPKCHLKHVINLALSSSEELCRKCNCPLVNPTDARTEGSEDAPAATVNGADPFLGTVFAGCSIESKIGEGGGGVVYMGHHLGLGIRVAVKVLPQRLRQKGSYFVDRFIREAKVAAKLRHPNIVEVIDVGQNRGYHYIVSEFLLGRTVQDKIGQLGNLWPEEAAKIAMEVAMALDEASAMEIVHRDVKPSNIIISNDGRIKLADFGLACSISEYRPRRTGNPTGTPAYMSPEQCREEKLTCQSDIYSLGITLFHMLAGRIPFDGRSAEIIAGHLSPNPVPSVRKFKPEIKPELALIVRKMCQKDRKRRYLLARHAVKDLGALLEGLSPPFAYDEGPAGDWIAPPIVEVITKKAVSRKTLARCLRIAILLLGILLVLGGMALLLWRR